jgi:hypothetical protein
VRWYSHRQGEQIAAAKQIADQAALTPGNVLEQADLVMALQFVQEGGRLGVGVDGSREADQVPA